MAPGRYSYLFFRTLYLSAYILFFVALVLFLAVTPGDHIYQTISNQKLGNVFVVGGTYVVTGVIVVFIYASRLYTNRTALAAIPKPYLPIEDGEVSRAVRKMIVKNRERSALVLLQTKPRKDPSNVKEPDVDRPGRRSIESIRGKHAKAKRPKHRVFDIDPADPPWGSILHPGWSAPDSPDLPDLQFATVIDELPNLLEARAVSLAPPDPAFSFANGKRQAVQPPADPAVVAKLQRRPAQGLRQYLGHLVAMGVLAGEKQAEDFLGLYEEARFSSDAVTEEEFRALMARFSALLESMGESGTVAEEDADREIDSESRASSTNDDGSVRRLSRAAPPAKAPSIATTDSQSSIVRHVDPG